MREGNGGKLRIAGKMLAFIRPYLLAYVPGILLYSSQTFMASLLSAFLISGITATALAADARGVMLTAGAYIGLNVLYMAGLAVGVHLYIGSEMKATRDLKVRLFRAFVQNSLESAQASHSGEGIAAINTDADTAAGVYGDALSPLVSCIISIVFSALVVFMVDYRLGLASVAIGLFAFFIQLRFSKPLGEIEERTLTHNAASIRRMSDILSGALAIRAFGAQKEVLLAFDRENGQMRALSFRKAFVSMWQTLFTTVQGWLTLTGIFALGGYLVATGRLDFPSLMMVPPMCQALTIGMSGIGAAWAAMQAPVAASRRVFSILDRPTREPSAATATATGDYALRVRGLSFRYRGADKNALDDIDLDIGENQMVAFVGESGSGKSTLLRALIGMYERDAFDMWLGDMPFGTDRLAGWRARFAYVDQSCKLFDMTVAENLALGRAGLSEEVPMQDIRDAARAANADGFIEALAQGYDTPCGEKGASLSGGQKQRLAIARALVRRASVLVFDEATSALDAESEKLLMRTIEGLRGNHTILITTHNLDNIVRADRIIVMDAGRIAETGTHDQLLARGGLYAGLYRRGERA